MDYLNSLQWPEKIIIFFKRILNCYTTITHKSKDLCIYPEKGEKETKANDNFSALH